MTERPDVEPAQAAIDVPDLTRTLLLAIVDGWAPEELAIPAVNALNYGPFVLSELSSTITVHGDRLIANLGGARFAARLG